MSHYRSIGYTSSVDESLFGNNDKDQPSSRGFKTKKLVTGPLPPSSVVISMNELSRIMVRKYLY